jgi:hypothetical protein
VSDRSKIRDEIARAAQLLNRVQRQVDSGASLSRGDLAALERARLILLHVGECLPLSSGEEQELLRTLRAEQL